MSNNDFDIFYSKLDGQRRLIRIDSATSTIEYSLDGGKTWQPMPDTEIRWK